MKREGYLRHPASEREAVARELAAAAGEPAQPLTATDMQRDEVWVRSIHDDSPCPAWGLVVLWEDEDWCWVVWGEPADRYRGWTGQVPPLAARREPIDELAPQR